MSSGVVARARAHAQVQITLWVGTAAPFRPGRTRHILALRPAIIPHLAAPHTTRSSTSPTPRTRGPTLRFPRRFALPLRLLQSVTTHLPDSYHAPPRVAVVVLSPSLATFARDPTAQPTTVVTSDAAAHAIRGGSARWGFTDRLVSPNGITRDRQCRHGKREFGDGTGCSLANIRPSINVDLPQLHGWTTSRRIVRVHVPAIHSPAQLAQQSARRPLAACFCPYDHHPIRVGL